MVLSLLLYDHNMALSAVTGGLGHRSQQHYLANFLAFPLLLLPLR